MSSGVTAMIVINSSQSQNHPKLYQATLLVTTFGRNGGSGPAKWLREPQPPRPRRLDREPGAFAGQRRHGRANCPGRRFAPRRPGPPASVAAESIFAAKLLAIAVSIGEATQSV